MRSFCLRLTLDKIMQYTIPAVWLSPFSLCFYNTLHSNHRRKRAYCCVRFSRRYWYNGSDNQRHLNNGPACHVLSASMSVLCWNYFRPVTTLFRDENLFDEIVHVHIHWVCLGFIRSCGSGGQDSLFWCLFMLANNTCMHTCILIITKNMHMMVIKKQGFKNWGWAFSRGHTCISISLCFLCMSFYNNVKPIALYSTFITKHILISRSSLYM